MAQFPISHRLDFYILIIINNSDLNVWTGIVGNCLVGPSFLSGNSITNMWLNLLQNLIDPVPTVLPQRSIGIPTGWGSSTFCTTCSWVFRSHLPAHIFPVTLTATSKIRLIVDKWRNSLFTDKMTMSNFKKEWKCS